MKEASALDCQASAVHPSTISVSDRGRKELKATPTSNLSIEIRRRRQPFLPCSGNSTFQPLLTSHAPCSQPLPLEIS